VPFVVAELGPDMDPFMLHVYAALTEKERRMIAERTRSALAAKRANGAALGNPCNLNAAGQQGRLVQQGDAARFSANIISADQEHPGWWHHRHGRHRSGAERSWCPNGRGGRWHCSSVRNVILRSAG
jgi:hypothetical protein